MPVANRICKNCIIERIFHKENGSPHQLALVRNDRGFKNLFIHQTYICY